MLKSLIILYCIAIFMDQAIYTSSLKSVVISYQPTAFIPAISSNCHWQTIFGSGALLKKPKRSFDTILERIETPDGDFFDVEFTSDYVENEKIVFILHGLESSSKGVQVTNFAEAFIRGGYACCLVCFRGCNGEMNRFNLLYTILFLIYQ
jgi:predicted alpha/beta-fold hydrolase